MSSNPPIIDVLPTSRQRPFDRTPSLQASRLSRVFSSNAESVRRTSSHQTLLLGHSKSNISIPQDEPTVGSLEWGVLGAIMRDEEAEEGDGSIHGGLSGSIRGEDRSGVMRRQKSSTIGWTPR
jgi:hypothetical protein